jgi:peptidoglycan/LPS O-acetylase OafA/YrhL
LLFAIFYVEREKQMLRTVLLVLLVLFLLGALPTWPYSANWGYYPTGGVGLLLIILIILIVADVL